MNSQTGKGRGRGLGKRKLPRDSRRPSPAKSRVTLTGAAKGGPSHGTRIQPGQCLLCRQMGHLARDCPNRGTVMTLESISNVLLAALWGMTIDSDVSLPVLKTTPQQEIVQYSDFNMSHVPVVIWLSLLVFVEQFLFRWCHQPALSSAKHGCSVGTQTEPQSISPPSPPTQQRSPRTVLITENGMKSTKVFSLINSLQHFESFDEGYIFSAVHAMSYTFSGESLQSGQPLRWKTSKAMRYWDTGASSSVGDYMMVQYVIDCLSRNTSATMVGVSGSCSEFHFCWRREGSFRDSDLVAASRDKA